MNDVTQDIYLCVTITLESHRRYDSVCCLSVIRALLLRISIMFHEYLRSTWAPSTILLLREETKDYRQRERLLGYPRADAFRPASTPPQSGPDALHTKDEIIKLAMGRATEMFEEATSEIMGVMTEEVLQVNTVGGNTVGNKCEAKFQYVYAPYNCT
jgi:hypothetical protein